MRFSVIVAAVFLAACEGGPAIISGVGAGPDECNARQQRSLVGRTITSRAELALLAPKVRIIETGGSVTQDDQPDRLNIVLDEANRVTRVYCG